MKKSSALVLLLVLLFCVGSLSAQTRARRVGQGSTSASPQPTTSHPPVLGGANTTKNSGAANQTPQGTSGPEEVDQNDIVRVNTTLVTIPVSVMDREGRYAPNLRKEDFRLWEDGVEQQIAFFATVDKPFSVVLTIDTSSSTRFQLNEIQDAAIAFVNQLQPGDRVMVVSFDDKVRVLTDFTSDRSRLRNAIMETRTGNGTKLYEAVDMIINQKLANVEGKKAIVLFTDGVDTTSRHASYESTVRDAEELDALIFPVQYDTFDPAAGGGSNWPGSTRRSSGNILIDILGSIGRGKHGGIGTGGGSGGAGSSRGEYERGNRYLHELADRTGARVYEADSTRNLSVAFGNVAEELRRQYSLGYYPKSQAQAGQRRSIRVRTTQPNLAVRARDSYIVNSQGSTTAQATQAPKPGPVLKKKLTQTAQTPGIL
jgi:Ca-activated chloride channel family protein